ncbi:hypothetical protein HPB51_012815 [Rhipicephalus microplus]|uniref:Uncharacterized protein n=1 Tax=Rhipicephalus microplus TaxID=6941 RepID=A0A9J6E9X1_RHIMP|nr:hypothetical protein HPB51_012815 [Rhipicephalus microplus]
MEAEHKTHPRGATCQCKYKNNRSSELVWLFPLHFCCSHWERRVDIRQVEAVLNNDLGKQIVLVCVSFLGALSTACLVRLIAHSISALSYSLLKLRHVLHLEDMMTEQDDKKPKTAMFASHNPSKQFNGEARKST